MKPRFVIVALALVAVALALPPSSFPVEQRGKPPQTAEVVVLTLHDDFPLTPGNGVDGIGGVFHRGAADRAIVRHTADP